MSGRQELGGDSEAKLANPKEITISNQGIAIRALKMMANCKKSAVLADLIMV